MSEHEFTGIYVRAQFPTDKDRLRARLQQWCRDEDLAWHVEADPYDPWAFDLIPSAGAPLQAGRAWELARELSAELSLIAEPQFRVALPQPRPVVAAEESVGGSDDQPALPAEWSVNLVRARQAWALSGARGKGILIGHPDTGYTRHPEVEANLLTDRGANFEEGGDDATDRLGGSFPGHGTRTASVIVSPEGKQTSWPNKRWVTGTAPAARLIPIRASDSVANSPGCPRVTRN